MGKRENTIETYLNDQVVDRGGLTRKWVSPGRDGVPDRIVVVPVTARGMIKKLSAMDPDTLVADIHLVEVKTDDGKYQPGQIREHRRLRDAGCQVETIWGHSGVDEFIKTKI